ncbi:hypothetical protein H310_14271 [Aphanomyces invadans]|uniref:GAG-pre-integrase domain-containing protein n=1 Tax=Aphanomyces invadans TaxID=157072 RepID=A0A024TBQ3_9STRA|nr:hypothetical protein H310_14271 [Aphanomyces invadans]ETV91031.1 hypothetical protein H310_14271 [Aphanomyces invadans]|eukprot:XP_008880311.1 hypothetical protein H310_14271 [Aphanomyces invadans]
MGTMRITTDKGATLVMENVLVIDNMPSTLLSVTAMMRKDPKFADTFKANGCSIMHDSVPIATATLDPRYKVYVLDQATVEHCKRAVTNHARNLQTIRQISGINDTPGNLHEPRKKCECCVKNKITKTSPPKTHTRSFKPGEYGVSDTKADENSISRRVQIITQCTSTPVRA